MKNLIKSIDELQILLFAALPIPQEIKIHDLTNLGGLATKIRIVDKYDDLGETFPKYFINGWHSDLHAFEKRDKRNYMVFEYFDKFFLLAWFPSYNIDGISMDKKIDFENFNCYELFRTGSNVDSWVAWNKTVSTILITRILNLKLLSQIKTIEEVQPI